MNPTHRHRTSKREAVATLESTIDLLDDTVEFWEILWLDNDRTNTCTTGELHRDFEAL